ncbi:hypothetical protein WJX81_003789 [Elliptochloris bilobata]|uniref:Protein kinase domain-containing protein n=1 Tax=Elliptochloris bilobata TaxID=381761 RepID=A0AAW1SA96_9CHLO
MEDGEAWRSVSFPDAFDQNFARGDLLGRGSFGTVYRVVERASGDDEYAVKVIPKKRDGVDSSRIQMRIREEVDTLQRLQTRPETIRLRGVYEDADNVYIVTEMCMGGDLEQLLEARGTLSEADAARVAHDVLQVLQECHSQGILYADIKPSNFLLKEPAGSQPQLEIRVVDFGCSQRIQASAKLHKRTGTPLYMAPELFMRYYGVESDMWALGMLLYQLLSGTLPFWEEGESQSPFTVMTAILAGEVTFDGPAWQAISPHGKDLVRRLLDRDYNSRLSATDALAHPWIAEQCGEDDGCDVANNVLDLASLRRRRAPEHAHQPSIILPD